MTVEDRLREARAPEPEAARERARRVVLAATPTKAGRRRRWPALLAVVAAAAGVALTPPGEAVARWLEDLVTVEAVVPPPPPELRLEHLPATGQLLAAGNDQSWVVASDGSRRRLGDYADLAWSPRGLFAASARDRRLQAIATDGSVRWTVDAPGPVADPRWSPSGYRVAYRSGSDLWIVAGDGTAPRRLTADTAPDPAAWQPGPGHVLAAASLDGTVDLWSVDDARRFASLAVDGLPVALLWAGPTTLIIVGREVVSVVRLSKRGAEVIRRRDVGGPVTTAALLDGSLALAIGTAVTTRSLPRLSDARLRLTASGPVSNLVSSPDGRQLLVASEAADQWVFLPARPSDPVRAVTVRGLTEVSDWQTEPLASAALADGRRIAITAKPGGCLVITGIDEFDRQCGRAPSGREPQARGDLMAGPIAQASPDAPYEVYGETSAAAERVRLTYRSAGGEGEQHALVLRATDRAVLRRAGIDEPFGYYFAELPPDATGIVATALGTDGTVLATDDSDVTAPVDVSPKVGGPFTRFRVQFRTRRRTGTFGAVRTSYSATANRRQNGVCRASQNAYFRPAPAGRRVASRLELTGEGSETGWCAGRYRGTITYYKGFACPARGVCDSPADAPDVRRAVARFSFRVRP